MNTSIFGYVMTGTVKTEGVSYAGFRQGMCLQMSYYSLFCLASLKMLTYLYQHKQEALEGRPPS